MAQSAKDLRAINLKKALTVDEQSRSTKDPTCAGPYFAPGLALRRGSPAIEGHLLNNPLTLSEYHEFNALPRPTLD